MEKGEKGWGERYAGVRETVRRDVSRDRGESGGIYAGVEEGVKRDVSRDRAGSGEGFMQVWRRE